VLRTILLVHESKTIRSIIHNFILSECNDIMLTEAESSEMGHQLIQQAKFDAIISGNEMAGYNGATLYNEVRQSELNQTTPFILMSSANFTNEIDSTEDYHYLAMPFTAEKLTTLIDQLADPKDNRQFKRISINGSHTTISFDDQDIEGDIINFSLNGILCDITNIKQTNIMRDGYLTLNFPENSQYSSIKDIWCKVLRITVLEWSKDNIPAHARVVWQILDLPERQYEKLNDIIQHADNLQTFS
jgi:CheY-like chemotaxis protein